MFDKYAIVGEEFKNVATGAAYECVEGRGLAPAP